MIFDYVVVWRGGVKGRGSLINNVPLLLIILFTHAEKLLNKENVYSKLFFPDRSGAPSSVALLCAT